MDSRPEKLKKVFKIIQEANPNLSLNFTKSYHGNTGEDFWYGYARIEDPLTQVNFPSRFSDILISHPVRSSFNYSSPIDTSITALYAKYDNAEINYSITPKYILISVSVS